MEQMGWLAWIVVGAISGWLASLVMRSRLGIIGNVIVGILGALIGGVVFNLLGMAGTTGFNLWSVFVAFIGAVLLLGLLRFLSGRSLNV